ncbi:MAG: amidase family protein [Gemmatimonadaceae bacterium]
MTSVVLKVTLVCAALLASHATAQKPPAVALRPEVVEATIPELQAAMAAGKVTSVQLVDAYLARIAAYDAQGPELNAMLRLNPRARADAARLDRERREGTVRGPLHGIPIVVKDNFDTADLPTSGGLLALAGHQPRADAFVVRRLRDAGVVILGKTNLHELAHGITSISSLGGQTRNPYDPSRNPGGSSGGTGAAVAASFAALGVGSDTCGSIRIPCAYNNLVGLRPTQGLVSRTGVMPLSHTQDIAGPLARTVTDLAIALDVTIAIDSTDPASRAALGRALPRFTDSLSKSALRGARLGVLTHYFADTDEEIRDTVRAAIAAMKALGAEVVDVRIPGFDSLLAGSGVIPFEMKFDIDDYLAKHAGAPIRSFTEMLERGSYHEALEARYRLRDTMKVRDSEPYTRALAKQVALRERLVVLFDSLRLDALVYPTMRQRPALIGEPQSGGTCQLSAHSGLPALSMPAGFTTDGLPIGMELLGRPFADARLVTLAYAFEQSGTRRRPPPTTPRLVHGRAPAPVAFVTTATASAATARAQFSFDPLRNRLGYEVSVTGVAPERVQAVVLSRVDSTRTRVVHRLSGPGAVRRAGAVVLSAADRKALAEGRLILSLFTTDRKTNVGDARLGLPR